ncbi:Cytochrome c oxidase subunit NDUFA4 [Trichoplax sp. H2]|nr:Cytochrome c oxidase subunit NDUFA4 [Trichoplax sp. H2]|eukprot:RDD40777.1 Cytochrome c oxidase subunit NDUFA4 [Trichoplax sp. H2]
MVSLLNIRHVGAKHPGLIPLFVIIGIGVAGAGYYTFRLATHTTDVVWNRKKNPYPWLEVGPNENTKFVVVDRKEFVKANTDRQSERPEF